MQALRNENIKVVCINPAAVETEVSAASSKSSQDTPPAWQCSDIIVLPCR